MKHSITVPTASFTIRSISGNTTTVFNFDAFGGTNSQDTLKALQVPRDWEYDVTWNTDYSSTTTAIHSYATERIKMIESYRVGFYPTLQMVHPS